MMTFCWNYGNLRSLYDVERAFRTIFNILAYCFNSFVMKDEVCFVFTGVWGYCIWKTETKQNSVRKGFLWSDLLSFNPSAHACVKWNEKQQNHETDKSLSFALFFFFVLFSFFFFLYYILFVRTYLRHTIAILMIHYYWAQVLNIESIKKLNQSMITYFPSLHVSLDMKSVYNWITFRIKFLLFFFFIFHSWYLKVYASFFFFFNHFHL